MLVLSIVKKKIVVDTLNNWDSIYYQRSIVEYELVADLSPISKHRADEAKPSVF